MISMKKIFIIIFLPVVLTACKDIYVSPVRLPDPGYLVVEGVINSGAGNTTIKLSRTTLLTDGTRKMETGATVVIQDENNGTYPLAESIRGEYAVNDLNLDPTRKYRLRIVTNGKEYLSDYVAVNNNPPIDSISWNDTGDGVNVAVNTHDPQNTAKYFQWDYIATWEIHSDYLPGAVYDQNIPYYVYYYDPPHFWLKDTSRYKCWRTDTSRQIILGSSVKYSVDTISNLLTVIEAGSDKLTVLYSINVRQFTYTKEGYEFLQKMKKNTEQLGSVFDAQPSELQGNIHSVSSPEEIVVGNVSICPIQEKRVFLSSADFPNWSYSSGCYLLEEPNDSAFIKANNFYPDGITPFILPVDYIERNPSDPPPYGRIITFSAAKTICIDCRLRGSPVKPDFWP